jgi:hypothetical protein
MGPFIYKFEGKNYMSQRYKMQTILDAKELWGLIYMSKVKPKEENVIAIITYTKKENKAQNLLFQSLSNNQSSGLCRKKPWPMGFGRHLRKGMSIRVSPIRFFSVRSFHVIDEPQRHHGATCQ